MVLRMDALFTVEGGADQLGLNGAEKLAYRLGHGETWLNEIHEAGSLLGSRVLPKRKIGEAVTYLMNQWEKLKRTFLDPEVELSITLRRTPCVPAHWNERTGYR